VVLIKLALSSEKMLAQLAVLRGMIAILLRKPVALQLVENIKQKLIVLRLVSKNMFVIISCENVNLMVRVKV